MHIPLLKQRNSIRKSVKVCIFVFFFLYIKGKKSCSAAMCVSSSVSSHPYGEVLIYNIQGPGELYKDHVHYTGPQVHYTLRPSKCLVHHLLLIYGVLS